MNSGISYASGGESPRTVLNKVEEGWDHKAHGLASAAADAPYKGRHAASQVNSGGQRWAVR